MEDFQPGALINRLSRETFSTAEAALASGTPVNRFAQRLTEGRFRFLAAASGTGSRRAFTLRDIYFLRLCQALAADVGMGLPDAQAVVADAAMELLDIRPPADRWPPEWPESWRSRDVARPVLLLASRYLDGWRTTTAAPGEEIADAVHRLPKPPGRRFLASGGDDADDAAPMALVLLNLTRELRAVDRVLLTLRPEIEGVSNAD